MWLRQKIVLSLLYSAIIDQFLPCMHRRLFECSNGVFPPKCWRNASHFDSCFMSFHNIIPLSRWDIGNSHHGGLYHILAKAVLFWSHLKLLDGPMRYYKSLQEEEMIARESHMSSRLKKFVFSTYCCFGHSMILSSNLLFLVNFRSIFGHS